jgi:hypothetical protein
MELLHADREHLILNPDKSNLKFFSSIKKRNSDKVVNIEKRKRSKRFWNGRNIERFMETAERTAIFFNVTILELRKRSR